MRKHSLVIKTHTTSIRLEDEFWQALGEIAQQRGTSRVQIITQIDDQRPEGVNLASAIRLYILRHYRDGTVTSGNGDKGAERGFNK